MTKYALPTLKYDYGALEPHLSGKLLELHHGKHHKAYVDGANQVVDQLAQARESKNFDTLPLLEQKLAFNVAGHVLHSLYWRNLAPKAGGQPTGELKAAIDRDFGSFEAFKKQLIGAANTTMGSGWAALVWEPAAQGLLVSQIHDHQAGHTPGSIPLMVVDAWEHAFYLQFQTDKAKYFDALWNLWNWDDIGQRYGQARRTELNLG